MKKILLLIIISMIAVSAHAGEKTWSGAGDDVTYSDGDNWYPTGSPTLADDLVIDAEDASITCTETFYANSITIGGRETVTLASGGYVLGTVQPATTSGVAIDNRLTGTLTLSGPGKLKLKGQYKDSEAGLTAEPSFMFWVE